MSESHSSPAIGPQTDSSQDVLPLAGMQVLLLRFLQDAGAEVTLECNGQSAVDAVIKSPTLFDAVVMDFQMPELGGLDATRQLRELGYSEAIIAVTAYGTEELKQAWFQAGCDEFFEKPLEQAKLINAVRRHSATKKVIEA